MKNKGIIAVLLAVVLVIAALFIVPAFLPGTRTITRWITLPDGSYNIEIVNTATVTDKAVEGRAATKRIYMVDANDNPIVISVTSNEYASTTIGDEVYQCQYDVHVQYWQWFGEVIQWFLVALLAIVIVGFVVILMIA